ncbi:MAG: 50S ribosomal protein L24, partial [Desulfohalobiaceae bacterium]|nr:50S ribosomal protein L24 [Desulfohalobiaceae bacterium]
IQDKEAPLHYSNLALIYDSCTKPTKVRYTRTEDGRMLRFWKKCNEMLD